jgi:TPR repeat protein
LVASRPAVEKPVFVVAAIPLAPPAVKPVAVSVAADPPALDEKAQLEKLAAALKARPATIQSATLAVATSSRPTPSEGPSEQAARFCAQGLIALAAGDIASARLFLKRAADAGDARAWMALGDTYDAPTLTRLGVVGMHGDSDRARDFYARALAAGVGAARERIAALEARGN